MSCMVSVSEIDNLFEYEVKKILLLFVCIAIFTIQLQGQQTTQYNNQQLEDHIFPWNCVG